jgi:hypothetical protein
MEGWGEMKLTVGPLHLLRVLKALVRRVVERSLALGLVLEHEAAIGQLVDRRTLNNHAAVVHLLSVATLGIARGGGATLDRVVGEAVLGQVVLAVGQRNPIDLGELEH